MGLITGLTRSYLNDWGQKIREEEKYLRAKERIEDMRSEGRRPYKSDLERVSEYEKVDNSLPEWTTKQYWMGDIGAYYWDRATSYVKERW